MKFTQLYSGSKGNFYVLESVQNKRVLIDPGVTWSKAKKKLRYDLSNIVCALCGHGHFDHSKAVPDILRAGIPVYASKGTLEEIKLTKKRNTNVLVAGKTTEIPGGFSVFPFPIQHDAAEPLGFVIRENETGEQLLFATDTAYLEHRFSYQFSIVALECSYQKEILEYRLEKGLVDESLAKRLLFTHMELQTTRDYLRNFCDLGKCRQIHLLHCSGDNLDIKAAADLIAKDTFCEVITRLNK